MMGVTIAAGECERVCMQIDGTFLAEQNSLLTSPPVFALSPSLCLDLLAPLI